MRRGMGIGGSVLLPATLSLCVLATGFAQETERIGVPVPPLGAGPDGFLYALTDHADDGVLLRTEPWE